MVKHSKIYLNVALQKQWIKQRFKKNGIVLFLCPLGEKFFNGCGINPTKKNKVCVITKTDLWGLL